MVDEFSLRLRRCLCQPANFDSSGRGHALQAEPGVEEAGNKAGSQVDLELHQPSDKEPNRPPEAQVFEPDFHPREQLQP